MARKLFLAALLAGLALGGCKKESADDTVDMAAVRARRDSIARQKALRDSIALARYAVCRDSIGTQVAKTGSGRRALQRNADSVYAAHCGDAPATTAPAVAAADTAKPAAGTAPPPAQQPAGGLTPQQQQVARADSIRRAREAARTDSLRQVAARRQADSVARLQADSLRADSLQRLRETEVLRETFTYQGAVRDPFMSLLDQPSEGPEFVDLTLVAIYQDLRYAGNSIAVLRDRSSSKRFNVRVGDRIGRMRIAQIRQRDVVFTIEDLGFERQETLSLRKREDANP